MSVRLEQRGPVLIVHNTSDRRGAITPVLYDTIQEACLRAAKPDVRCIILTGGAFFCAGGDLKVLATRAQLPLNERRAKIEALHETIRALDGCPVPVIAAIEGGAAGAGFSLAMACDLIVAAENSAFTAAYVKAGLTPDGGMTYALARQLPRQLAMELCLLGRSISAEQLGDLGVVTQISPAGLALEDALSLAGELVQGPPRAQTQIRQLLTSAQDRSLTRQLDHEADAMAEAQGSAEAAEGIAAFFEKRKAEFPT